MCSQKIHYRSFEQSYLRFSFFLPTLRMTKWISTVHQWSMVSEWPFISESSQVLIYILTQREYMYINMGENSNLLSNFWPTTERRKWHPLYPSTSCSPTGTPARKGRCSSSHFRPELIDQGNENSHACLPLRCFFWEIISDGEIDVAHDYQNLKDRRRSALQIWKEQFIIMSFHVMLILFSRECWWRDSFIPHLNFPCCRQKCATAF